MHRFTLKILTKSSSSHIIFIAGLVLSVILGGCGPKEVGQNYSSADYEPHERNVMSDARYPMDKTKRDGDLTQQRLYIVNQPAYMIQLDEQQKMYFQNRSGGKDLETERNRPKQTSPFKEQ